MDEKRLESIPLFAGLSRKERRSVAQRADEVDLEAGREIVREGEYPYEFFAIEEGTAEVKRGDQHLAELGPGDFFGEMGLIENAPRNASVVTRSPLTAVVMTGSAFRQIDRELPEVSKKIRKAIDERCRHLMAVE
ncbi:MAG: cyclic nucleotide-binding domain-containing protein [Thermoleophilaceae bacterium]|jgi:CRP/FNR family transcriptional regulator, cyclic AMP receptor protein